MKAWFILWTIIFTNYYPLNCHFDESSECRLRHEIPMEQFRRDFSADTSAPLSTGSRNDTSIVKIAWEILNHARMKKMNGGCLYIREPGYG